MKSQNGIIEKLKNEPILFLSSILIVLWIVSICCFSKNNEQWWNYHEVLFEIYMLWALLGMLGIAWKSFTGNNTIFYKLIIPVQSTPASYLEVIKNKSVWAGLLVLTMPFAAILLSINKAHGEDVQFFMFMGVIIIPYVSCMLPIYFKNLKIQHFFGVMLIMSAVLLAIRYLELGYMSSFVLIVLIAHGVSHILKQTNLKEIYQALIVIGVALSGLFLRLGWMLGPFYEHPPYPFYVENIDRVLPYGLAVIYLVIILLTQKLKRRS